ncbi:HD domain-containing protein [Maridesulfovibrio sp.]|uniref:HD domain-containing protein n=1 Tax=Maridesulfovibrio sp. TaxID=2795000 RepID=UPI0029CA84AA|nr:HD domain-containing protein [Maridesulfovibrio sp.]
MNFISQDTYMKAWNFAAQKHLGQCVPGTEKPYILHVGAVAMEVMSALAVSPSDMDCDLAVCCALLHDTIEDTETTYEKLEELFGKGVADGVTGLTKDKSLPDKKAQMSDSLERLKKLPHEAQLVKLADRVVNLQPPPSYWTKEKCAKYREEAKLIHEQLKDSNKMLADRLASKILNYKKYC